MPRELPPIFTAAKLFVWYSPHEYSLYSHEFSTAFPANNQFGRIDDVLLL